MMEGTCTMEFARWNSHNEICTMKLRLEIQVLKSHEMRTQEKALLKLKVIYYPVVPTLVARHSVGRRLVMRGEYILF